MLLELKLPVLDAKSTKEDNLKKFKKFILKYLDDNVKIFYEKGLVNPKSIINIYSRYFNDNNLLLRSEPVRDNTLGDKYLKSLLTKISNKDIVKINDFYNIIYKNSLYPVYKNKTEVNPIYSVYFDWLTYAKAKKVEEVNKAFLDWWRKIAWQVFPFINVLYYLLACEYFVQLIRKLKLPTAYEEEYKKIYRFYCLDILTSKDKNILAWKTKQNQIFTPLWPREVVKDSIGLKTYIADPTFNIKRIKLPTPDGILKTIIASSTLYKENIVSNLWQDRKEYAKVYQHNNLWKANIKGSAEVMKNIAHKLDNIQNKEIKDFLSHFKGIEIDKTTNMDKLNDFFFWFIKITAVIQKHILTPLGLDMKRDIFPKVFFKIRKLWQYKAHGIFFPWNKTLIVDINGWKSIIHEVWHMVHFILQEYYPNKKIENYIENDRLPSITGKHLLFFLYFYKYASNFLFKNNVKWFCTSKMKILDYFIKIEKVSSNEINILFDTLEKNWKATYFLKDKAFELQKKPNSNDIIFYADFINQNDKYFKSQSNFLNFIKKINLNTNEHNDINFLKEFRKDFFLVYNKSPYTGSSSFKNYITSPIEIFARIFDYYIRYALKVEKALPKELMTIISNDIYLDEKGKLVLDKKSKEIELLDMKIIKYLSNIGGTQLFFNDLKYFFNNLPKV